MRITEQQAFTTFFWLAIIAILSLMLIYQFGYDQYVFAVGGEKIVKHGAIPFRDIMDTKPMLIMYIYGISSVLFGYEYYSIRIIDCLYHLISMVMYFIILRSVFQKEVLAYISVFLYTLLYVSSGAATTAQAESFILLPTLCIFYSLNSIRCDDLRTTMIASLLISSSLFIILCLKPTLVIIPIALMIWKYSEDNAHSKQFLRMLGCTFLLLTIYIGFSYLWLIYHNAASYFREYLDWVSDYNYYSSVFSIKNFYDKYYAKFTSSLSITLPFTYIVLFVFGVYKSLETVQHHFRSVSHRLFYVAISVGILTLWLENKYILYQYLRLWWAVIPFISIGLYLLSSHIRESFVTKHTVIHRPFIVILILFGLFFSPVFVIYDKLHEEVSSRTDVQKADFISFWGPTNIEQEIDSLQYKLGSISDSATVCLFGQHAAVYFRLNKTPPTMMLTNPFFTSGWTIDRWKQAFISQLRTSYPDYFIVEQNDAIPITNNSALDSRAMFNQWEELYIFVNRYYRLTDSTNTFLIYKK